MLLIKYDGITSVSKAIKTWHFNIGPYVGLNPIGFYFIKDDVLTYSSNILPNEGDVIYNSSDVAKWDSSDIQSFPKEIYNEVRKRSTISNAGGDLSSHFVFNNQPEGYDFWDSIRNNKFYKFYDNKITNNYETELQDKNSSVIRGTEPKRNIICGKKGCASITSGYVEYGRISRGK